MRKLELLLAMFVLLTVGMRYSYVPGAGNFIYFSLICLMFFYIVSSVGLTRNSFFITNIRLSEPEERPLAIIKAFAGFVFAFALLTMLANEMFWRSRDIMVIISAACLSLLMLFSMIFLEAEEPLTNRFILIRSSILSACIVFLYLIPLKTHLEWLYSDQYYREILQYSIENPDDLDAEETVINYERRMQGLPPLQDEIKE
jgi:hypothetical protein